jgi:predicted lipid-binding transport protein (Tim44 family)
MNRKIAAVLLTATMLTTPAFAASVASSPNTATTQTVTPDKVTKTSDKSVKKHRVHARASYGHKVHHVKHATRNQVKHTNNVSKESLTSASTKSDTKTVTVAPVKAPIKN